MQNLLEGPRRLAEHRSGRRGEEESAWVAKAPVSGDLGRPRFFSSTFGMQVRDDNIRTKREHGGGPLLDLGIYCVNAARSFFRAEPVEVAAISATTPGDPRFTEVDEQVTAVLRFPGDRLAQLTCSFGTYDHSALTVVGERGRLQLDPAYEYASGLTVQVDLQGRKSTRRTFAKRDQIAAELVAFARCVRTGEEPEASGVEGLADLRVLDAIRRAVETGRTETVSAVAKSKRPTRTQVIRRPAHSRPGLVHAAAPGRD
jgi:predicted dehydrogenase